MYLILIILGCVFGPCLTPQFAYLENSLMPRDLKAYQFWVTLDNCSNATLHLALSRIRSKNDRSFEFTQNGHNYQAKDLAWDSTTDILTGTVYLLRSNNLPSAVKEGEVSPLPIDIETDLGEPMCFAVHPNVGAALVHYSHNGPRHSVLPALLGRFVSQWKVIIQPVLRADMLEKLDRTEFVTGLEFTLNDPQAINELRTAGGSVSNAIEMLGEHGGVTINVHITMGHTRGQGMIANSVRAFGKRLQRIATQQAEPGKGVTKIKVKGSEGEDAPLEELDLLKAREAIIFTAAESHRSIDTSSACRKLKAELSSRLDDLSNQRGTE